MLQVFFGFSKVKALGAITRDGIIQAVRLFVLRKNERKMLVCGILHVVSNEYMWIVCVAASKHTIATATGVPDALSLCVVAVNVDREVVFDLPKRKDELSSVKLTAGINVGYIRCQSRLTSTPSCSCFVTWRETSIQRVAFFLIAWLDNSRQY